MLDRLAADLFDGRNPAAVLHDRLAQELALDGSRAELRLDLPFVSKSDVALRKIGLELVVRVDGHKRTIVLPGALASLEPTSARLDLGQLAALIESLRGVVPPELMRQLADALRQLLLALRAVLDWYIARLEADQTPPDEVQDIPVE